MPLRPRELRTSSGVQRGSLHSHGLVMISPRTTKAVPGSPERGHRCSHGGLLKVRELWRGYSHLCQQCLRRSKWARVGVAKPGSGTGHRWSSCLPALDTHQPQSLPPPNPPQLHASLHHRGSPGLSCKAPLPPWSTPATAVLALGEWGGECVCSTGSGLQQCSLTTGLGHTPFPPPFAALLSQSTKWCSCPSWEVPQPLFYSLGVVVAFQPFLPLPILASSVTPELNTATPASDVYWASLGLLLQWHIWAAGWLLSSPSVHPLARFSSSLQASGGKAELRSQGFRRRTSRGTVCLR